MCLHYRKNPRKEFLLSMQYKYQTIVVPFLYGPILPQRSHFIVGLWWATGPTLPRYWPNFTPNYGVMMSRWIFSVLFELIIVNWNPFQRWFSEVAPVSWHINLISRSYGWGVRAKFVIFGCSLPHLTICHHRICLWFKYQYLESWKMCYQYTVKKFVCILCTVLCTGIYIL